MAAQHLLLIHVRVLSALLEWLYAFLIMYPFRSRYQENAVLSKDVFLRILMLVLLLFLDLGHAVEIFPVLIPLIAAVETITMVIVHILNSPSVPMVNGKF
jgi:hypothetical protein